jgi:hypothetical protein
MLLKALSRTSQQFLILILSLHLIISLPTDFFRSGFSAKPGYAPIIIFLLPDGHRFYVIILAVSGEECTLWSSNLRGFFQRSVAYAALGPDVLSTLFSNCVFALEWETTFYTHTKQEVKSLSACWLWSSSNFDNRPAGYVLNRMVAGIFDCLPFEWFEQCHGPGGWSPAAMLGGSDSIPG